MSTRHWLGRAGAHACAFIAMLVTAARPAIAADVEYPPVVSGYAIEFPRDEGSHPQFRIEWWYLTGWLETPDREPLGFQVTFFRTRPGIDEVNPSSFAARQLLFAHLAVTDPKRGRLLRAEKSARAGFGLAAAAESTLDVRIDDWFLRKDDGHYRASLSGGDVRIELEVTPTQPPLLQGKSGFSQKGPAPRSASYYYSLPQLRATGRVALEGREHRVTGVAWFDHEWSSEIMDEQARGWDWVGLNLDDGGAMMAFRMRDREGRQHWAQATVREGKDPAHVETYAPQQITWTALRSWRSPRTGIAYPVEWKIQVGGRTIWLRPLLDDQESDARGSTGTLYWEGAVQAFDASNRPIGRGYLELTGYGERVVF